MYEDSFSANGVDPDPKITSTSFDVKGEPPALPCRDGVLVENGAAAPKSCLSLLKMRTAVAGGLLPTGKASRATKITFDHPTLWFCLTKETNLGTSTQSVSYDSSFFWKNNLHTPSCQRAIETKSEQNRMFDPGGSQGRLRACPFWGT